MAAVYATSNPTSQKEINMEGLRKGKERPTGSAVPGGLGHRDVLKTGCLNAVDQNAPHPELAHNLVKRGSSNEELLCSIGYV